MNISLGIDTSAYTTSVALVDEQQHLLADERIVLPVDKGKRGLRQSEAMFYHTKNLPHLFNRLAPIISAHRVASIAVSAYPRRVEGSYMPVFLAGLSQARTLSSFSGVPLYEVSHQEGHIMAGLVNNDELFNQESFLAVHFSGGTSEVLNVRRVKPDSFYITVDMAGSDLHAGQLVDRIGVAMGLPFPSGRKMEELACQSTGQTGIRIASAVTREGFSFSGAENQALNLIKQGVPCQDVAFAVLRAIANTLEKSLLYEAEKTGQTQVLLVGGVMANSLIRQRLVDRLEHPSVGFKLYFASPQLSTDNAVGVAMLGSLAAKEGNLHKNNEVVG
ncbi:MAG: peptidase M22 [Syntrophomonadaceae bacterium]|jgi:N6-L-threonylcarbamoyladenine synthase